MVMWRSTRRVLQRKKVYHPDQLEEGNLRRCLNFWDLTGLGLGSTLGVGVYVLVGTVGLRIAGPSIVLSFLIAAVSSLFAGLCYAEFGSRVPRAGSAYVYSYVTVGELAAFLIGWNMLFEGIFGTASVARGLSAYIDSMAGGSMMEWFSKIAPISSTGAFYSAYFDFFAFALVVAFGLFLSFGVKESSTVNNVFALVNLVVIVFIILAGAFKAQASNWSIPASEVPSPEFGTGGFFPYGVAGMFRGAAICFYGFVGFDSICSTGEEVKDPRHTIPRAILTVLAVVFVAYCAVATVVTMMVPYYTLDSAGAVAMAFTYVGWDWARWIVSVGAVFGIVGSLFGSLFPLPRVLYAMAADALLPRWLARVSRTKQPVLATLIPSAFIAVIAAVVQLQQLVMMMCIGTLFSYTIVALCVVIIRYRSDRDSEASGNLMKLMMGCGARIDTKTSAVIVNVSLFVFVLVCLAASLVGQHAVDPLVPVIILHILGIVLIVAIAVQPQNKEIVAFKTPFVPLVPCLSVYVNIQLMILVDLQTWIRVLIWIAIGIPIYITCVCCYNRTESEENIKTLGHSNKNGKAPVQIIVESPTPPNSESKRSNTHVDDIKNDDKSNVTEAHDAIKIYTSQVDEVIVKQAVLDIIDYEEKEAKIIDLLDQVLQAEEDSYGEVISLKEIEAPISEEEKIPHRKSLSELSDAGSDASSCNQVLSKYDVIAQVHREDLPKVEEDDERFDKPTSEINEAQNHERITAFNDSESNSHTDESGYSDTLDRNALTGSAEIEQAQEEAPYIPPPPPLDEKYFEGPYFKKAYSIPSRSKIKAVEIDEVEKPSVSVKSNASAQEEAPYIPPPPPLDEKYFQEPYFQKSYSIPSRPKIDEVGKPRVSIKSNASTEDGTIVFGSDRQMNFMSKLTVIFQNKMTNEEEEPRPRSHSSGNVANIAPAAADRARPLFLNELKSMQSVPNLKPVNVEEPKKSEQEEEEPEDTSLSREELKSKLVDIFTANGPNLMRPRLMKSNNPTPEESYQTDVSSSESVTKLPKMDKNDTLKRQKQKFSEVLNSFRTSMNKDESF